MTTSPGRSRICMRSTSISLEPLPTTTLSGVMPGLARGYRLAQRVGVAVGVAPGAGDGLDYRLPRFGERAEGELVHRQLHVLSEPWSTEISSAAAAGCTYAFEHRPRLHTTPIL